MNTSKSTKPLRKAQESPSLRALTQALIAEETSIMEGGGIEGQQRQKRLGRLTARERIALLLDKDSKFLELNLWAAWKMYEEWGGLPAAGSITGVGEIHGYPCMIIANDATVKAGAMFPQSVKKVLRAQRIASECRLPLLYLVDSSGVFLPLQEDVFPDEDDFGRIFRNNAVISASGLPQFAAIMGSCIAGGGYLPVLCDKLLMTEGSGLYLAGPALVKAAIGQVADPEELGGAKMHASISGTVDFCEKDDKSCLARMRALVELLPKDLLLKKVVSKAAPARPVEEIYDIMDITRHAGYDVRDLLACIVDKGSMQEYKADYGRTLVTVYAKINNIPVGIVANQRIASSSGRGEIEMGGVIYADSADKAARFVMDCNQMKLPLIFFQDVMGFMVGKEAEQSGIIRSGAKLVSAVSNSVVPKITVVVGNSFGAGNYALCGKAYDPNFIVAWPNAKYTVMGADQAADTLWTIQQKAAERRGMVLDKEHAEAKHAEIKQKYSEQMDMRYGAARGWIDAIIAPDSTRDVLTRLLGLAMRSQKITQSFHTGVIQV